jgi:hypothetical protein
MRLTASECAPGAKKEVTLGCEWGRLRKEAEGGPPGAASETALWCVNFVELIGPRGLGWAKGDARRTSRHLCRASRVRERVEGLHEGPGRECALSRVRRFYSSRDAVSGTRL